MAHIALRIKHKHFSRTKQSLLHVYTTIWCSCPPTMVLPLDMCPVANSSILPAQWPYLDPDVHFISCCGFSWSRQLWNKQISLDLSPILLPLRYADDTTLVAESEEELKNLLMRIKEESEKAGLKLNIQKTKIMASDPILGLQNHCRQ